MAQTDAPKDEGQTALTVKQMLGIAEALKAIHYWRIKSRNKAAGCSVGAAAAGQGYHGDLKPENILVMDGRWKLADFGLSSVRQQAAATTEQRPLGFSPTYRAPEHDGGHFDGQQADMWSLGCVMSVAATWMALGRKGVRNFRAKRALRGDIATRENGKVDDSFFEARDKKKGSGLRVKPAVTHVRNRLSVPIPKRFSRFTDLHVIVDRQASPISHRQPSHPRYPRPGQEWHARGGWRQADH